MSIDRRPLQDVPEAAWRTSSYSGGQGECVAVAAAPEVVPVRDTKQLTGPILGFSRDAWAAFLDQLR